MADHLRELDLPTAGETLGTTQSRKKSVSNKRGRPPTKELKPLSVKVPKTAKVAFERAYLEAYDATGITKGDFLTLMINGFLNGEREPIVDKPSDSDRDAGRTERLPIWATPDLASVVRQRADSEAWSVSATVENAIAAAVKCAQGNCQTKQASRPPAKKRRK